MAAEETLDTILIVDDEESVRRTFVEWLQSADLGCRLLAAADAEQALRLASAQPIDLAILDWNLGAGDNGLDLLQDLRTFHPDIVAILVTAYANQATPLDAMRMGVRDYLDKNQELDRRIFVETVLRQLRAVRPAKRERLLHRSLLAFREAVEKVLPLVQACAALMEPAPLPAAVRSLFDLLLQITRARDGVLLLRRYGPAPEPAEVFQVYDRKGELLSVEPGPFARSLAAAALSQERPLVLGRVEQLLEQVLADSGLEVQPFERGWRTLLVVPQQLGTEGQLVWELFDKQGPAGQLEPLGFSEEDQRLAQAVAALGAELLRQALTQRQTHRLLLDAVAAALETTQALATSPQPAAARLEEPLPEAILEPLRRGLQAGPTTAIPAEDNLRLAEAIRQLALRYGSPAVQHCLRMIDSLRSTLDALMGA